MSGVVSAVASVMSLILNGVPVEAAYLESKESPCVMTEKAAVHWEKAGHIVSKTQVARWCSAGTVINGKWVAEQWQPRPTGLGSQGWRLSIPLSGARRAGLMAVSREGFEILDLGIQTRIQVRRSQQDAAVLHQKSVSRAGRESGRQSKALTAVGGAADSPDLISRVGQSGLVVTGSEPGLGSYSVVITRNLPP